jgi:hypothetical protein
MPKQRNDVERKSTPAEPYITSCISNSEFSHTKSKSSQILASSSKARPKKIKGINFVFLVRIEPYQDVTPTPRAFFSFLRPFPA